MKIYEGSEGTAPRILNLGIRWKWAVSFTLRPLCAWGKSPPYPLPLIRTERWEVKNKISLTAENRTPICRSYSPVTWSLNVLSYPLPEKGIRGWWNVFKRSNVENMTWKIRGKHLNSSSRFTDCLLFYFCMQMVYVFMLSSSLIRKIK